MTLTEFLLACIDEDESVALNAMRLHLTSKLAADDEYGGIYIGRDRVLAECDAKRRVVAECISEQERRPSAPRAALLGRIVIHLLARPYVDHPDYQQEWKL